MDKVLEKIHIQVIQYCNNKDLKSLRLTSKYWQNIAIVKLFSSLTVFPYTISLERLSFIAGSEHLRHLVKRLLYDGTVLTSHGQAGADVDNAQLLQSLEQAFSRLANLNEICVCDATDDENLSMKEHLPFSGMILADTSFQRTGSPSVVPCADRRWSGCLTSHICSILRASCRIPNHAAIIDLQGFFWSRLLCSTGSPGPDVVFDNSFAELRVLRLTPSATSIFFGFVNMPDLQYILRQAQALGTLDIDFGTARYGQCGEAQSVFALSGREVSSTDLVTCSPIPSRLSWSTNLTTLSLTGLVCTLTELQSVLTNCANSLKSLSLTNLIVVPEIPMGHRTCLVRMLEWFRVHLWLEHLMFGGYLTNEGLQLWEVDSVNIDFADQSLYSRVVQFVTHGGPCPLYHVSIEPGYYDFAKESAFSMFSDEIAANPYFHGDPSWRMSYLDSTEIDQWSSNEGEALKESADFAQNNIQIQFP